MLAVLLVIHLIIAVAIVAVILIQPSESGGFLGSSGSMSNLMMPRRSADVMTRLTTILAGCFFLTSLLLAIAAGNGGQQKASILDVPAETPAATATETAPTEPAKPETPRAPISK